MKQDLKNKNQQFSNKSSDSLNYFLKQLTEDLNKEQVQDLPNKISNYIFNAILYIKISSQNLPLFEESKDLLNLIKDNQVVIIRTSTGSGKSTLLPPLLVAQGYQNILVTQPRRLPCKLIYNQIKSKYGRHIAGWEVSGISKDCHNPLIYLTDGLIKERIQYDSKYVDNYSVIMLDEIHERSLNMDVILGLLSYIMSSSNKKLKVIISSATLDKAVKQPFIDQNIKIAEFENIVKPKFLVQEKINKNQSYMNILLDVITQKKREDQILVFLNSLGEITQATEDFKKLGGGVGYPLFAQQAPAQQMDYLANGSVFFSTNIAETSLTIQHLKYVIDTGQLNLMYFDYEKDAGTVIETYASKSSVKQRRGRLGRTNDGLYITTYVDSDLENEFAIPEIQRIYLLDLEFSLWKQYYLKTQNNQKSQGCWKGLNEFQKYLPTKPKPESIKACQERLKDYEILENNCNDLTNYGRTICKLPFTGQLQLLIAIDYGLNNGCGQDIIQLACIMVSLQNSANQVVTTLGKQNRSEYGHFSSLFNTFHQLINIYENNYRPGCNKQIEIQDISDYCHQIGVDQKNASIFLKAIILYKRVKNQFMNYKDQNQDYIYRDKSQESTFNQGPDIVWEKLARCLMKGYFYNIFMNLGKACGDDQSYIRLSKNPNNQIKCYLNNKLYPDKQKPEFLLTCDISYSPRLIETAQIGLMGIIKPEWIDIDIKRIIEIHNQENNYCKQYLNQFPQNKEFTLNQNIIEINGNGKKVISLEQELYTHLINNNQKKSVNLKEFLDKELGKNEYGEQSKQQAENNLKEMMTMDNQVFYPLTQSFKFQYQVIAKLDKNKFTFNLTGRELYCNKFIDVMQKSMWILARCKVIRKQHSEVRPQHIKHIDNNEQIEQRIQKITDPKRTSYDIWESTVGSNATRISRMEVVCWVACTQFDCQIEGGFIRDWVVGGFQEKKPNNFKKATDIDEYNTCPKDLDIYLPYSKLFFISRFKQSLINYHIKIDKWDYDGWRYLLTLDEDTPTGPFTIDLIESHAVVAYDSIDFDVNSLFCEKGYTKELGMKVDLRQPPINMEVGTVIEHIVKRQCCVLNTNDNRNILQSRVEKMKKRGWTILNEDLENDLIFVPNCGSLNGGIYSLVPRTDERYKHLQQIFAKENKLIVRIEFIMNKLIDEIYQIQKKQIIKENKDANEKLLFHGTSHDGAKGIIDNGFDNRFFSRGRFGYGGYFADDIKKSFQYAKANSDNQYVMLWCRVLLGKQDNKGKFSDATSKIESPAQGNHSVFGQSDYNEYIIYRVSQAKVFMKITYR